MNKCNNLQGKNLADWRDLRESRVNCLKLLDPSFPPRPLPLPLFEGTESAPSIEPLPGLDFPLPLTKLEAGIDSLSPSYSSSLNAVLLGSAPVLPLS